MSNGCVSCHAVNGIGGHDAPALDAHDMPKFMNPFHFAAKMWNHAPAMVAAQDEAFGEQVQFTGQELAGMIAFAHDDEAQHEFTQRPNTRGEKDDGAPWQQGCVGRGGYLWRRRPSKAARARLGWRRAKVYPLVRQASPSSASASSSRGILYRTCTQAATAGAIDILGGSGPDR